MCAGNVGEYDDGDGDEFSEGAAVFSLYILRGSVSVSDRDWELPNVTNKINKNK